MTAMRPEHGISKLEWFAIVVLLLPFALAEWLDSLSKR